jgi:transcriptional regulator with XRE-family HTH domain
MSLKETFSENVKKRRVELELTQGEMAAKCGMVRQVATRIENNGSVTIETLERVAKALNIEPYKLLKK